MLTALHQKGIRLGIISNTGNSKKAEVIAMLPSNLNLEIFEKRLIIFSHEAGLKSRPWKFFRRL